MLKKAKWVKPDQSQLPVSQVAAEVVRERLEVAWHYAPLAAGEWRENVEYVHQLRVATRRAAAALETFADLAPPKRMAKVNKSLRRLRRAAGEARDLDVLSARLREEIKKHGRRPLRDVLGKVASLRDEAQPAIVETVAKFERRRFAEKCGALCGRIRWRLPFAEPSYGEMAPKLLHRPVDDFFAASEADLSVTENLHALRIEGKRLRYAMELLAGAFDDPFRDDLYLHVRELQDQLGRLNDHASAQGRFIEWSQIADQPAARREFEELADEEAAALEREKSAFLAGWTDERREHLEQKFRTASSIGL